MKLTRPQLEKIKSTIDFIIEKYDEFADHSEDLELKEEDIDDFIDNDYELPSFPFPGEPDYTEVSTDYFLEIADEIPTIKLIDNSIITTTHLRYYIVDSADTIQKDIIMNNYSLSLKINKDIIIDLVSENFIVGLAATSTGEYDEDLYGTISPYTAIEIKYKSEDAILSPEKELEAVKSYIFEIADSTGIALTFSKIRNPVHDYEELKEEAEGIEVSKLRDIENYNEGMRLFVSAIQIQEYELKFLNFYKILEHFAPIAVNIEAYELMRKKLDASKAQYDTGDYIHSIFDLAQSMRAKFNDEDLIKSTFFNCFDFIGLFESLPDSIKSKVKKQVNEKGIDYNTDKQKISIAANMIGKFIYSTRNRVVHAKSNYESTGNECSSSDLKDLNSFMKEACSQTIRWYNRQPQHLKLTIIQ
jgi:hypothetical protein